MFGCATVYVSFSSYQLCTAGALLQYIAAASEAECIADTMGNISQYFLCPCVCLFVCVCIRKRKNDMTQ